MFKDILKFTVHFIYTAIMKANQSIFQSLIALMFTPLLIASTVSCTDRTPIKIGFTGTLTGIQSERSIMIRNRVLLAVNEINEAGGINNRPIEIIIKNDQGQPGIAQEVDKELIDAGVSAIIGHTTSRMSEAGSEIANIHQTVMISPTTSTDTLTDKDDYFFRISTPSAFLWPPVPLKRHF